MPRARNFNGASSGFQRLRRQALSVLSELRREIRRKEAELQRLRDEESSLGRIAGGNRGVRNGRGGGRARIDWSVVLQQMPKQFKAGDVRSVREVRNKRPSEVFAAITRWIDAGAVKRKARGVYERVNA
jgi:hypothetical protein